MKELLRRTWAEIDLDALAQNFREVRKAADPKAMVCCVVKADAYGHGAVRVAREFASLGADWFAVSNLEEALQLRQAGIETSVLVLGYTPADKAGTLSRENISQCVYSLEYARDLSRFAQEAGVEVNIHLKIDTGMSRLGFYYQDISRDEAAVEEVKEACSLPGLVMLKHKSPSKLGRGWAQPRHNRGRDRSSAPTLASLGLTLSARKPPAALPKKAAAAAARAHSPVFQGRGTAPPTKARSATDPRASPTTHQKGREEAPGIAAPRSG